MHIVLTVLVVLSAPSQVPAEFVALFTPLEYRFTGGGYDRRLFEYRLYVPSDTSERMPLVVWLHGLGEAGHDNVNQLRWLERLIFRRSWKDNRYPYFLLAVQCPLDNPAWTRAGPSAQGDDMIDAARAIMEEILRNYPVDPDRVYLAGLSSGGSGCWEFAARYPEYFGAVAPLASGGAEESRAGRLVKVPIWAFHSQDDAGTPIDPVRATVAALKAAGGNVHLTEVLSGEHDCWRVAFDDYHLLDWLLSQRRGQAPAWQPGTIPWGVQARDFAKGWRWWQVLAQVGIPLLIVAVAWHVVRARRRASGDAMATHS